MKSVIRKLALIFVIGSGLSTMTASSFAEVYFEGPRRGSAVDKILLDIFARAGTTIDSIDISPDYEQVADVLSLDWFVPTDELKADGIGLCTDSACAFFFIPTKSFATDTLLASFQFSVAPSAPAGPVDFNLGVVVGEDPVLLPPGVGFQVLVVPEPSISGLILAGLSVLAAMGWREQRARDEVKRQAW